MKPVRKQGFPALLHRELRRAVAHRTRRGAAEGPSGDRRSDMPSPRPLPEQIRGRPFTVTEALALGIGRNRLTRSDLTSPVPGVRIPRLALSADPYEAPWERVRRLHLERAGAEAVRMPFATCFSHITAGLIHGFPLDAHRVEVSPIHVTAKSDAARRQRDGVKVHPLPRDLRRTRVIAGLRVTHPIDTWCALSSILSVDELVAIGDHLVRRQKPEATMAQLAAAVSRYAGRHGSKRLREAFELVRPMTDSVRETQVRVILVRAELPEPAINIMVRDREGRRIKLGDMVYESYRVLVEYDGEQHRTDAAQYDKDAEDLERAASAGWLQIRVRKGHLRHPAVIAERVRHALRSRGWPDPPTTVV